MGSSWGGKRVHLNATRRICRRLNAEFTANKKPGPDCKKRKWWIQVKAWKDGRCLDKWYYKTEVAKGANWIVVPCWSDTVARMAKEDGVKLTK